MARYIPKKPVWKKTNIPELKINLDPVQDSERQISITIRGAVNHNHTTRRFKSSSIFYLATKKLIRLLSAEDLLAIMYLIDVKEGRRPKTDEDYVVSASARTVFSHYLQMRPREKRSIKKVLNKHMGFRLVSTANEATGKIAYDKMVNASKRILIKD